ncbi:sugar phosphate isomerase/epimerase family protein [Haematomicrobium sanguinis]|uniref:sugar phosphate isomerase/epimerase family protein n=1 Tax=Haematomicrobium sanguinis TaxID=479106 RepID=UPI00047EC3AA|nr:sugar phosphate isomerase/epimerase family protein [Haematomicrobium sanguinis]
MPTWKLSGFADEIDTNPDVQLAVLKGLGANHVEVRSAWETNVIDLSADQLAEFKDYLAKYEMGVSAIGSPIGKVDIDLPPEHELERLDRAINAAKTLGTGNIRMFSFYYPGKSRDQVRNAVVLRLKALTERASENGITLLHENEKDIYGDTGAACAEILQAVDHPNFRAAFDPANFVQVGDKPYTEAWPLVQPWVDYLQVKDARFADQEVTASGDGDGEVAEIVQALVDRRYAGFASMEPHLAQYTSSGGFSGAAEFGRATRAFRKIAEDQGVTFE